MNLSVSKTILLYNKQKGQCAYCRCDLLEEIEGGTNLEIDHIVPQAGNKFENLCISCRWCNRVKGDRDVATFMAYIQPVLDGKIGKADLADYNVFVKLREKFKDCKF